MNTAINLSSCIITKEQLAVVQKSGHKHLDIMSRLNFILLSSDRYETFRKYHIDSNMSAEHICLVQSVLKQAGYKSRMVKCVNSASYIKIFLA